MRLSAAEGDAAFFVIYGLDQVLVVRLQKVFRRRQPVEAEGNAAVEVAEQPVPPVEHRKIGAHEQQRDEDAQQQRVQDGLGRQVVQAEHERENAAAEGDEQQ